ncbi:MAG: phenylalanine--tRNA ligase subunit alpha [Candidatus Blackburnbacteria bacterium]|nr:phenylalanine--tRNA ligase subunit alpha [Candidatus Blackburnbacteria bacterium]
MEERLQNIKNEALAQIISAEAEEELENLRVTYLGRKGKLNSLLQGLKELPSEKRPPLGKIANDAKEAIERALSQRKTEILHRSRTEKWFDPTIPGERPEPGHLHLITQAIEEISKIFEGIGFVRVRYPEVEWDWYAFESLNMPKDHPARDEWETFFLDSPAHLKYGQMVLTPHTSSGQVREMERVKTPPIRMVNIAKCYRRQSDVSHVPMFHQFEGLVIDKGISIAHLKGTLDYFARRFFGPQRKTRLRPFHFQFTEPSFEVDVSCGICRGTARLPSGQGCKLCKGGWLELGGAGIVHPAVLKNGGIDPKIYTGFAFGWGVERTFMMKSGLKIDDIRILYSADLRFLRQF